MTWPAGLPTRTDYTVFDKTFGTYFINSLRAGILWGTFLHFFVENYTVLMFWKMCTPYKWTPDQEDLSCISNFAAFYFVEPGV